ALCGRCIGRIRDAIDGACEIDGEHRRAGVDVAGDLTLGEHARRAVEQIDRDRRETHRDLALEQRHATCDRHPFARRDRLRCTANTTSCHHRKSYRTRARWPNFLHVAPQPASLVSLHCVRKTRPYLWPRWKSLPGCSWGCCWRWV